MKLYLEDRRKGKELKPSQKECLLLPLGIGLNNPLILVCRTLRSDRPFISQQTQYPMNKFIFQLVKRNPE